eukprot:Tamp_28552.p1 GENE.Tamp_28552~~Tamp_28552.p1  ORF type:complete len:227 (+),score=55.77 Tamp_28552:84-683(+)
MDWLGEITAQTGKWTQEQGAAVTGALTEAGKWTEQQAANVGGAVSSAVPDSVNLGFIKVAVTSEAASAAREPATPRRPKPLHHASSPLYLQEQRKQQERDRKHDDALEKCNQLGEEIGKLHNLVSELQKIRTSEFKKHSNFAGEHQHPAVQKADTELKEAKAKLTDLENKRQKYMDQHQRDVQDAHHHVTHHAHHGHRR